MGAVQGEVVYCMCDLLEMLQEKVWLLSGPKDVMFCLQNVSGMDRSFKGHAMRLCICEDCTQQCKVIGNLSNDVLLSEESERRVRFRVCSAIF